MDGDSKLQRLLQSESLKEVVDDRDDFIVCETCGVECDPGATTCWSCGGRTVLITLVEYGRKLPVGIVSTNNGTITLDKSFDLGKLDWTTEREIGRYWTKTRDDVGFGEYISTVLAHTITNIGKTDVTKLKINHRIEILKNMFVGDVFYMYAYLRLMSMGKDLKLSGLRCVSEKCGKRFDYTVDVGTMGVVTIDDATKLEKKIELQDGFDLANDHQSTLIVRPPTWESMCDSKIALSTQDGFETSFLTSVVQIGDLSRGAVFTDADFTKMTKTDIEICREIHNRFYTGPMWIIEGQCPVCGEEFTFLIDWQYSNFFARSYTSNRRKRRSKR